MALAQRLLERRVQLLGRDLPLLEVARHQLLVDLDHLVDERAMRGSHRREVGLALGIEEAVDHALAAVRRQEPSSRENLIRLAADALYPVIVRATAIASIGLYPAGGDLDRLLEQALMDPEALIRRTALDHLNLTDPRRRAELGGPMLYDPVKAVRIQAASLLAGALSRRLSPDLQAVFDVALKEYIG